MAQQVTADAFLLGLYKRYYTDKEIRGLFFRNSPTGRTIEINKFEGQTYQFTVPYDRGGSTSGDYTISVANAASAAKTAEVAVTPGNIFTVFLVTQKEYLAARTKRGGYLKALGYKLFGACEGTRKLYAASLFGYGYGDLGYIPGAVAGAATSMTLNYDTVVKLAIGSQFFVINSTTDPSAAVYDVTVRTVSAINGNVITWTGGGATAGGWAAGSILEINGGRDATPNPNMPTGLAGWLPYNNRRTGAGWTTYIGTAFYGVTRSTSVNQLAGWYVEPAAGDLYIDTVVKGVQAARRGGGVPDMVILNDDDWITIQGEINQQTLIMQQNNVAGAKNSKNEITRGLSALRFAMSTSWIENVYDDPYCTKGYSWILDKSSCEFVTYGNAKKIMDDGIVDNEPGAASAEQNQEEPDTSFKLLIDDYLSIDGNATSAEGPAAQVSVSLYGNFAFREPGHCATVNFLAH
jgi:hypothetical protein